VKNLPEGRRRRHRKKKHGKMGICFWRACARVDARGIVLMNASLGIYISLDFFQGKRKKRGKKGLKGVAVRAPIEY